MILRTLLVSLVLLAASTVAARSTKTEPVPVRRPLDEFPLQIASWQGVQTPGFSERVLNALGVDDYLTRVYARPGEAPVELYIGYYESQRQGDTIHSPMNCLPGAGWIPISATRATMPVEETIPEADAAGVRRLRRIEVNRFLIQKGLDRQVVLYWYQSHGRAIASEYRGRLYMVLDAIRLNRTDAALIRVISPVADSEAHEEESGFRRTVAFVEAIFPLLGRHLPV